VILELRADRTAALPAKHFRELHEQIARERR
jgi:hypothetical protein